MKHCPQCRHIRKITGNKKAKCCKCGITQLIVKLKISLIPVKSEHQYHLKVNAY